MESSVPYEIEFLPVGDGAKSGDAIILRHWDGAVWRVMVIDAGYESTGREVCQHIRDWYGTDVVDYVVSTHPDNDHMSGLRVVLEEMTVGELWMHVPALHAQNILPLFKSRRWLVENLREALRRAYPYVEEMLVSARDQGTRVNFPFQGAQIGPFTVLSPTLDMYNSLLPQFRDTPPPDRELLTSLGRWIQGIGRRATGIVRAIVPESWSVETLREGGTTSAENESSVVLYGDLGHGGILLTGDAGLRALEVAVGYAEDQGLPLRDGLWLFQVPHHGSRNNISPGALNWIVGPPVDPGVRRRTRCVISAGPDDVTHPRRVVVNALVRRGLEPSVTRDASICYSVGTPDREGWGPVETLGFSSRVEAYE